MRALSSVEVTSHVMFVKLQAVIWLCLHCAFGAHVDLNDKYSFSADLDNTYKLHWTFNLESNTISFAVNASTTGWVGLGLSPNGGMVGSDVVIGWVEDNGQVMFKDRFASSMSMPSIDASQDWFLVSGKEENGNTILEFTRNLTSCDSDNDRNVQADTSRVIWSYNPNDPESENNIPGHQFNTRGSTSLNLLGGLTEKRVESNPSSFPIKTGNVEIPDKRTTYWCVVRELPQVVRQQERYIYKLAPEISQTTAAKVHHILIYLCNNLNSTLLGSSKECSVSDTDIQFCRRGSIIAGWAVGGNDFVFPEGVALPLGGDGASRYVVLELHYDNPTSTAGVMDDSGIRFSYTNTPPMHRAGLLTVGGTVRPSMIIPPGADKFTVTSFCSKNCTQTYFPPNGVTVFGNLLHTHLAGNGMVLKHLRENDQCGRLEELMPLDENRRYDFNYQQFTNLPRQIKVLPGDEIQLECIYKTTDRDKLTLGGESTLDEMCYSFMFYYPQTNLSLCVSVPEPQSYTSFASQYLNSSTQTLFRSSLIDKNHNGVRSALKGVEWTDEAIAKIQSNLNEGTQTSFCFTKDITQLTVTPGNRLPNIDCPYVRPDTCSGQTDTQGQCCRSDSAAVKVTFVPIMIQAVWIILALLF